MKPAAARPCFWSDRIFLRALATIEKFQVIFKIHGDFHKP